MISTDSLKISKLKMDYKKVKSFILLENLMNNL